MPISEPKALPKSLDLHRWFAEMITTPLGEGEILNADRFVLPSNKLSPAQRVEIYREQYWWRLLSILHIHFPTLVRLFGYTGFNHLIGVPFLTAHPPSHFLLARLGEKLPLWLEKTYTAEDRLLVIHAAQVDWAYQKLFIAPSPHHLETSLELLDQPLELQDHVQLFHLPFDLFSFREEFLSQDVPFWETNDFPKLRKENDLFFILYRYTNNHLFYKSLQEGQWILLNALSQGLTLNEACSLLEEKGGAAQEEALHSLPLWIQEWIQLSYLKNRSPHHAT